jgi:hypothetical protein
VRRGKNSTLELVSVRESEKKYLASRDDEKEEVCVCVREHEAKEEIIL